CRQSESDGTALQCRLAEWLEGEDGRDDNGEGGGLAGARIIIITEHASVGALVGKVQVGQKEGSVSGVEDVAAIESPLVVHGPNASPQDREVSASATNPNSIARLKHNF